MKNSETPPSPKIAEKLKPPWTYYGISRYPGTGHPWTGSRALVPGTGNGSEGSTGSSTAGTGVLVFIPQSSKTF
eukprot:1145065-Rhodomonas_salina.1